MKGEKIQPIKVIFNVDVLAMQQDKARDRLSTSIPIFPRLNVEWRSAKKDNENLNAWSRLTLLNLPVQMPGTLRRQMDQAFELVEDRQSELADQPFQSARDNLLPSKLVHGSSGMEWALVEFSRVKKNVLGMSRIYNRVPGMILFMNYT